MSEAVEKNPETPPSPLDGSSRSAATLWVTKRSNGLGSATKASATKAESVTSKQTAKTNRVLGNAIMLGLRMAPGTRARVDWGENGSLAFTEKSDRTHQADLAEARVRGAYENASQGVNCTGLALAEKRRRCRLCAAVELSLSLVLGHVTCVN